MRFKSPKPVKEKKCRVCKKPFFPYNPLQAVCNVACAYEYAKIQTEKKEQSDWSKAKKKMQESLLTLGDYEAKAREVFQRWIRMRDKDRPCISCDKEYSPIWDGGHYLKAELFSGLIFNEKNCHKQCRRCNRFLGGNETSYREGLVKRYGETYVKELEKLKDTFRKWKYTKEDLIGIETKYKLKIKNQEF